MEQITNANYQSKISESKGVVLVDYFATWCGPCRMLTPILEQVAKEIDGKAEIFKVDVDQCEEQARNLGIMAVPTMIIFLDGKEVERIIGPKPKDVLISIILKHVK